MISDDHDDDAHLSDEELGESFKSPAADALERLEAREPPTDKDADLTGPILKRLASQEKVPFLIVQDGFLLGFEFSLRPNLIGYGYLRRTCQNSTRTLISDQYISALELDSEGKVGDGGMLYSPDPQAYFEGHDDDDGYDWETTNQQSGFDPVMDRSEMRLYLAEAEKLEAQGLTVETDETLAFYRNLLGATTYQGRIKSANPEDEKVRQRVWHAFEAAYEDMEGEETGTKETRLIAAYFRKYIKKGRRYRHTGEWKFRYS